jgi:hypothetical protein
MSENQFLDEVARYFPNIYDVKIMADFQIRGGFRSSLLALSEKLEVTRDDNCEHQAGSDSKITAKCFIEMMKQDEKILHNISGDILGFSRSN